VVTGLRLFSDGPPYGLVAKAVVDAVTFDAIVSPMLSSWLATTVGRADTFLANVNSFTFATCYRPSVCLSSVTLVRPTQAVQIFGNVSMALGTLAIH